MRSPIIPILGLPLGLLFSILPSSTSFNNPSPLTTCPIQFSCFQQQLPVLLHYSFCLPNSLSLIFSKPTSQMPPTYPSLPFHDPGFAYIQSHRPHQHFNYPFLKCFVHTLRLQLLPLVERILCAPYS